KFSLKFPFDLVAAGELASFTGAEASPVTYDLGDRKRKHQTFPVAMQRGSGRVVGIIADSPGLWENRCQVQLDPERKQLSIMTGDGSAPYLMVIKPAANAGARCRPVPDGCQAPRRRPRHVSIRNGRVAIAGRRRDATVYDLGIRESRA